MAVGKVVVIGAGVIGVTTAHALLEEGYQVTLLEAAPEAAQGTSRANGGFLSAGFCAPWAMPGLPRQLLAALFSPQAPVRWRPDFSLHQMRWVRSLWAHCTAARFADHRKRLVRLALLSHKRLRQLVAHAGLPFDFQSAGVLLLMRRRPSDSAIQKRLQDWHALGIDACWCEPDQLRALEPGLSASLELAGGFYVQGDGSGDCERFTQGLLDWSLKRGLQFEPAARVDALELDKSGRRLHAVRSGSRRWDAQAFVMAAGVESVNLLRGVLDLPVLPVKGYSVTLELNTAAGAQRAVIDESSKLAVARLGQRIRLAGMAELVGHDLRVDRTRCQQLIDQYQALYGPVPPQEPRLWAGLRPMTADGTPLIGATPIEGLYLNTGHGTYGWTLACGSAQLLADALARRPSALDLHDYALEPSARNCRSLVGAL